MAKVKKKWYAIKVIDEKEVNQIVTKWEECEKLVKHHKSVYKSFTTEEQAKEYLSGMTKKKQKEYLEKVEYGREKKKVIKETTSTIHIRVPNDIYKKFQNKLRLMKFDEAYVIIDMIKEWSEE